MFILYVNPKRQPVGDFLFPAQLSEREMIARRVASARRVQRKRWLLSCGLGRLRQWRRSLAHQAQCRLDPGFDPAEIGRSGLGQLK